MSKFVVIYDDNKVDLCDEHILSSHIDAIGPCKIYYPINGELKEVSFGELHKVNQDEEYPFCYAERDLVANGQVIGHMSLFDT